MKTSEPWEIYLPKYLSEDKIKDLLLQIKNFPNNMDKFHSDYKPDYWMQGDGFRNIALPYYVDNTYKTFNADVMLLSNTCDASTKNSRKYYNPQLIFAPIFNLDPYKQKVFEKTQDKSQTDNHIEAIRKQEITSMLYVPPKNINGKEQFIRFDHIFSVPIEEMMKNRSTLLNNRLFSLSNYGFYVLLFKISIHFTRIFERIDRG